MNLLNMMFWQTLRPNRDFKNKKFDGLISEQTDIAVLSGAKIEFFNIPGLDVRQAEILTDKFKICKL